MAEINDQARVHLSPHGPIAVAVRWLDTAVIAGDLLAVWPAIDVEFRTALVQAWLFNFADDGHDLTPPERDQIVAALGSESPAAHPRWREFADMRVERWRKIIATNWGVVTPPDFVTPDIAVVAFTPAEEPQAVQQETRVVAQRITLRYAHGGWRVACLGAMLPVPGWPPSQRSLD